MPDDLYAGMRAVLARVIERLQLPIADAALVHLHSNAIFALSSAGLVVRIATNPDAYPAVAASVAVTRWLAARGFPCTVPADLHDQPFLVDGHVVSVWRYVETTHEAPATGADLGKLLRSLHDQPVPETMLNPFEDPLASVAKAAQEFPGATPDECLRWLLNRIAELQLQWGELTFPHPKGLSHGDAHSNNLMRAASGAVILGDWDHVAIGPREWDLMQIHYFRRRFGHPIDDELAAFAEAYGWDVRDWADLDTLISVREISGLSPYIRTASVKAFSRQELAYRLDTLRAGDLGARWRSPSSA
jgi:aminoglycoside phosphotransferase (APT) family kinase protein